MSTYNRFKDSTIFGNLNNSDYPDGSVIANASFDRDLTVKNNLIIGNETSTTDSSGNITYTQTGGNITFKINNITYTIGKTELLKLLQNLASQSYVDQKIADLVGSASTTLDTLQELALALGNDPNFATTITNLIATKAPINSPNFTGTVSGITKNMVGLGNVDNTSDLSKPISTLTQSALNLKADITTLSNYPTLSGNNTFSGLNTWTNPIVRLNNTNRNIAISNTANFLNNCTDCVGIGYQTLTNNQGTFNTSIGTRSLLNNTTGTLNTACGFVALQNNTEGQENSAFGRNALANNTVGDANVAIGSVSGNNHILGNHCTFLGYTTGIDNNANTYNNSTAIGSRAIITASNQIVMGGGGNLGTATGGTTAFNYPFPTVYIPGSLTVGGTYRTGSYGIDLSGNINVTSGYFINGVNISTIYQPITSMSNYYLKTEIDSTFSNYYTKTQTDNISSLVNYYTKTNIDTNIYTKSQIDTSLTNYYQKSEVDTLLTNFNNYYTKSQIDTSLTNYYTKSQIDTNLVNYQPVSLMSNYSQLGANNTWTGTNKFNTSLPTSTLTPTLSTEFITKAFADATYTTSGNILGSNNIWTGTNQFNNNIIVNSTNITPTEISRLSGITSNVQTQINTINSNFSNYQTTAGMSNYMPLSGTVTSTALVYTTGVNIFAGRNATSLTANLDSYVGLHVQWNRVNANGQTFFMNRIASGSNNNGGFRFQRYNASSVYIDEPVTILDTISLNKNTSITGTLTTSGLLTASNGFVVSGTVTGLSKSHVALDQVDNTSDVNKPISTATQTALNAKSNINNPTFSGTVTTNFLTSSGLITANAGITIPSAQNINLNGNIITNTTPNRTITPDEISYLDGVTSNIQVQLNNKANSNGPTINNATFTGTTTGITKSMIGLDQVDNTSDINKPISSAVQSALDLITEKTDMITVSGLDVSFPSEVQAPAFIVGGTNIDVKFLSNTDANNYYLKKADAQSDYGRLSIMNTWTNFNTWTNRADLNRIRITGRNNSTATATGFLENVSGLHIQYNRNDDGISNIMNHKGSASGNGGFKFQRFDGSGNYIDDLFTMSDTIVINKNSTINGSLTTTSGIITTGITATTGNITTLTNTTLNTGTVNSTNVNGTTANFTTYKSNNYPLVQSFVCGYLLDGPNASKGPYNYNPILCSTARTVVNVDDVIIVYPGYKIVLYVDANYAGASGTCNNYNGTTPASFLSSAVLGSANTCDSLKVFYMSDSTEITITNIS